MLKKILLNLELSLLLILLPLPENGRSEEKPGEIRDLGPAIERVRARFDVPALAGAVVTSKELIALGVAGFRERGKPTKVTTQDKFHLGSCTKSMTATLAAMLVEDGKISWDTTLGKQFPDIPLDKDWAGVTLAQLLSHTGGVTNDLTAYAPLGLQISVKNEPTRQLRKKLLHGVTRKAPLTRPGSTFEYSNNGYGLAAAMLEKATDKSWEDLIQERLFHPLKMPSAGFGPPCQPDELDHPRGHDAGGNVAKGVDNPPSYGPAGTVHATLPDWSRYLQLHLQLNQGRTGLILKHEATRALHTPEEGTKDGYALGWFVTKRPWSKGPLLHHNGTNTVWFCWTWLALEEDFAVLAACNQGGEKAQKAVDAVSSMLIIGYQNARKNESSGR